MWILDRNLNCTLRSAVQSFSKLHCAADKPVHLALLLPLTGVWRVGPMIAGAAALAVKRVNADEALLTQHVLEFSWADSGCNIKQGLKALIELQGKNHIDAVIGPGCSAGIHPYYHSPPQKKNSCSAGCEVTNHLTGGQNLTQISYSCTSHRSLLSVCF